MIRITDRLLEQIPQHIRDEHPLFVSFMRGYFEWLEQEGNPANQIRTLQDMSDLDLTTDEYVEHVLNTLIPTLPQDITFDKRQLLRHINDLRMSKGSEQSYNLLFQMLFGESIQITYPRDNVMRLSDGDWAKNEVILFCSAFEPIQNIVNKRIEQELDGGIIVSGIITDVQTNIASGYFVNKINVTDVTGDFVLDDTKPLVIDGQYIEYIYPAVTSFNIVAAGQNYNLGDRVEMPSDNSFRLHRTINNNYNVSINYTTFLTKDDVIVSVNGTPTTDFEFDESNIISLPNFEIGDSVIIDLPSIGGFIAVNELGDDSGLYGFNYLSYGIGYTNYQGGITVESETGTGAIIEPVPSASYKIDGYYTNTHGQLSHSSYLHDGEFYQNYSYVILSNRNFDEYSDIVKNTIHPAGTKMFGALDMFERIDMGFSQVQDISRSIINVEFPEQYQVTSPYQNVQNLAAQLSSFRNESYPIASFYDYTADFHKKSFFEPQGTELENLFGVNEDGFVGNGCNLSVSGGVLTVTQTTSNSNFYKTFPLVSGKDIPDVRIKLRQISGDTSSTWYGYLGWSIEHYPDMDVSGGRYTKFIEPSDRSEWTVIDIPISHIFEWTRRNVNGINFSLSSGSSDVWEIEYILLGREVPVENLYKEVAKYDLYTSNNPVTSGSAVEFDPKNIREHSIVNQPMFGRDVWVSDGVNGVPIQLIEIKSGDLIDIDLVLDSVTGNQCIFDATVGGDTALISGTDISSTGTDVSINRGDNTGLVVGQNKVLCTANSDFNINVLGVDGTGGNLLNGVVTRLVVHRNNEIIHEYDFTTDSNIIANLIEYPHGNLSVDAYSLGVDWDDNGDKTYTINTTSTGTPLVAIPPADQVGKMFHVSFTMNVTTGSVDIGGETFSTTGDHSLYVFVPYDGALEFTGNGVCNLTISNLVVVESDSAIVPDTYTTTALTTSTDLFDHAIYMYDGLFKFQANRAMEILVKCRSYSGRINGRLYFRLDGEGSFNPDNYIDLNTPDSFRDDVLLFINADSINAKGNWQGNTISSLAFVPNTSGDVITYIDIENITLRSRPVSDKSYDNEGEIIYSRNKSVQTLLAPQESISYIFDGIDAEQALLASSDLFNVSYYYAPNRVRSWKDKYNTWPVNGTYHKFSFVNSFDGFTSNGMLVSETESLVRLDTTQANSYIEKNGLDVQTDDGKFVIKMVKFGNIANERVNVQFKTVGDDTWDSNKQFELTLPNVELSEWFEVKHRVTNPEWNSDQVTAIRVNFIHELGQSNSSWGVDYILLQDIIETDN